ncbi:DNA-binding MarR family transcriptional regulator [Aestuariispira insulae]|uniref:DNA-binding MarR family transcriptional regulator n=2 Tax=Aestuariispira insulae TaxID=1461337 RepID=A0A3D9HS77_9PROT|nr:DNA-binding MarR family transcriptional regulator [Aestuariispira insulae]
MIEPLYQAVQQTRPLLRHITGAVEAGLDETGLTVGLRAILEGLLLTGEASLPELTARLQLKRQFVHKMLGEGQEKSLVEALPHPRRKNGHHYRLSPQGRNLIEEIRARELRAMATFAQGFSSREIAAFIRVQAALNGFFRDMAGR